jgi:hypothetical protein
MGLWVEDFANFQLSSALREVINIVHNAGFTVVTGLTKEEKTAEWGVETFKDAFRVNERNDWVEH